MLYYLVRPVARYVLSYYYRNIDITGLENIPQDAAVILAANHPTAFIEPCILACYQPRALHFLARGNLFKNGLATAVLRALNILPVYRIEDGGYEKLSRNFETFEECYVALSQKKALMILAEGRCIHEKRLRPLRKGTARIALGALHRDPTLSEVYIVPVGVNFVAAEQVRSTVMIRCGAPIKASEYLSAYRDSEPNAIRELTAALRSVLEPHIVILPERQTDDVYESHLELTRTDLPVQAHGLTHNGLQLNAELATVAATNAEDTTAIRYLNRLQQQGVTDRDFAGKAISNYTPLKTAFAGFQLLPFLPIWLLAEAIALRGPSTVEFYSPVRFAAVAVGTLLYLPALLLLPWLLKIYVLIALLAIHWSIRQIEAYKHWRGRRCSKKLVPAERAQLKRLRQEAKND